MNDKYILRGHELVPVDSIQEWAKWFETADRHVALDELPNGRVSTVFRGLDHCFMPGGRPLLFETMVFGGPLDQEQERYSTWEEAEAGHAAMVERIKAL